MFSSWAARVYHGCLSRFDKLDEISRLSDFDVSKSVGMGHGLYGGCKFSHLADESSIDVGKVG